jgi:acyl-CoA synthetase (AMP-forming)/AMP-acid ligase II
MTDFKKILKDGCTISSSGTTGTPKQIYRSPNNLEACNSVAIKDQDITSKSRIFTCTRMTHAGGLLLQSLPAYTLGCDVHITKFNPFTFLKEFDSYTHTFLPPAMCNALIKTKGFKNADFTGKVIAMGSDIIPWDHIHKFVSKGATVIANWGMSEIGPCAINTKFETLKYVERHTEWAPNTLPIMGENLNCLYKIDYTNDQLYIKSDLCIHNDWFATGDKVELKYKIPQLGYFPILYYKGRLQDTC